MNLGEVVTKENISDEQIKQLKVYLKEAGLDLMEDKRALLVQRIKNVVIEMVHYDDDITHKKPSEYISAKLGEDYVYLSNLFSEVTSTSIEQYIIFNKIERVKELLLYSSSTLTQISYELNYSSVAHLSNQFKRITGLTTSEFKSLSQKRHLAALGNV